MKVNQLKAGVILSYVSEAITILSGLIYTPIMLRLLGQNQYGLYQLASSVISYLGILSMGFGASYVRYYARYKVKDDLEGVAKLNGMFMTIFIVIGIISALAGSVLIANTGLIFHNSLSVEEIKTAKILLTFMVFNLTISFPGSVFTSHITANEQYVFQRVVNILRSILNPFLTLPLLLMGFKSVGLVVIQTILSLAAFLANFVFCRKKLKMTFDFKKFEWSFLIELFMFSFWIFLNQIIDRINWSVDNFILGMFRGTTAVAVYGVASQLNSMYLTFSTSISGVFVPRVNNLVAKCSDNKLLTDLFTRVGRIQFIVLTLIISGLTIFGRYFIQIWAGEEYWESYRIALLLTIPLTIPLIQNLGVEIQRAKNLHKFRSIIYFIVAVLNVIISIPLVKQFGGTGAAIGTALSLLIGNGLIMNILYHKMIGLDVIYFWKQIARFVPALIAPLLAGVIVMKYLTINNIFIFFGFIALYTLIYCVSMWLFGMNDEEKILIRKPLKRILKGVH